MTTLPVIDLSDADVAHALHDACAHVGFFYVVNHGVAEQLIDDVIACAREFYTLPDVEKRAIALGPGTHWRGWSALGSEVTQGKRDWHECLDVMTEAHGDHPLHGANLWPARPVGFRDAVERYFDAMRDVGERLMAGIALSLRLPREYFAQRFTKDPWCLLRILSYPAQPAHDDGIGIGEHTDYGCLTLLTATAPGLSVRTTRGEWIDAPPMRGAFVCNLGDAMAAWTYGAYPATPHRVVASTERISIPFFFDPSLDAIIEPIESLRPAGAAHRAPFHYGDYLLEAYRRSYPHIANAR